MTWTKRYPPNCDACLGLFEWHTVIDVGITLGAAEYDLHVCSRACLVELASRIPERLDDRRIYCETILRNYAKRHAFNDELVVIIEAFIAEQAALI